MFRRISVVILVAAFCLPAVALAQSKVEIKIAELQRDVASLQDMVRQLQQSQDQKLDALKAATQQAIDAAGHANAAIAAIQTSLQQSLRTQEEKVVTPVVGLSTRMDNLTSNLQTTQNNVDALGASISKIMARLDDIANAVKLINAPVTAPPPILDAGSAPMPNAGNPTATLPPGGGTQPAPTTPSTPPMSSTAMYDNALNDFRGGTYAYALAEFQDFLKYYPDSPLASNAQFYIGQIDYAKSDFEAAERDFDLVIEKYPESATKNPESRYYKGMSLLKLGRNNQAETEFRDLILKHPRTQMAEQACQRIKELGKTCPVPGNRKTAPKKD